MTSGTPVSPGGTATGAYGGIWLHTCDRYGSALRQVSGHVACHLAPYVICGQPAVLRSPRGKPCHWTCALAWTERHRQAAEHEHRAA
jgi:hypothetical protein